MDEEIMKYTVSLFAMVVTLVALLALIGCTSQQRARNYGGVHTERLPVGRKLVTATWKGESLWVMTRPMTDTDIAEEWELNEFSVSGIWQGKVIFKEMKAAK